MIRSLKTGLGLSMLVALLVAAFGVMNASATQTGHFTSSSTNTKYDVREATGTAHSTQLSAYGSTVECHHATYNVHHTSSTTFTTLAVTPEYTACTTGSGGAATVRMNGCYYDFTSRTTGHATVHLICPAGKKAEVETSGGLEKFGAQTPTTGGVTYTNENGLITVNITVEGIHAECHGACQLLGTNTTTASLKGSVTVEGTDTVTGAKAHITAK
jgi:hypothetical protein